jgi:hypothetical protein
VYLAFLLALMAGPSDHKTHRFFLYKRGTSLLV